MSETLTANVFAIPDNVLLRVSPLVLPEGAVLVSIGNVHPCDTMGTPLEVAPTLVPLKMAAWCRSQTAQKTDDTQYYDNEIQNTNPECLAFSRQT